MYDPAASGRRPVGHPRRKILQKGARALTATELLTVVLGTGDASAILRGRGLAAVAQLPPSELRRIDGLGPASTARLCAAFEIGRRVHGALDPDRRPRISRPRSAYDHVRHLAAARKEHLVGLYLDAQNGLLHRETISIGSLNTTRTHPREILYPAVEHLALGFILAHNHPSGCLEPSPEDVEITRSVGRAGELMGIELYDHLIVAGKGFVSLRERGVLA